MPTHTLPWINNLVGRYVYEPYKPVKCGVVLEDPWTPQMDGFDLSARCLKVFWVDGTTSERTPMSLNDFQGLIDMHQQRLAAHEARLAVLIERIEQYHRAQPTTRNP